MQKMPHNDRRSRWRVTPQASRISAALAMTLLLSTCVDDMGDGPQLAMHVSHLSGACGGQAGTNPFSQITSYQLKVQSPDEPAPDTLKGVKSGNSLTVSGVRAGSGMQLTLVGNVAGKAAWFARRSGQKIIKNATTNLEMTLMAVEAFTCIQPKAGQIANVLFPSVTPIAGGRVLITGGFASAKESGSKTELSSASDEAWIFDPNTGELRKPKNNARMTKPRGAHSAIYLPKSNRVLIVGGAEKMTVDSKVGAPPTWRVSDGVGITYEVFDIATEKFIAPDNKTLSNAVKRVFPNLMLLSDDFVVSLGGAQWPASSNGDKSSYRNSNLYDPNAGDNGGFVSIGASLPLNTVRAGSAIAFLGTTPSGGSKYLIWGGDSSSNGLHAEVFSESAGEGEGVFNVGYTVDGDITSLKGGLYFPTLTPIGLSKDKKSTLFLSVGGVRNNNGKWAAPDKKDAYIVAVNDAEKTIKTTRATGLDVGVYLHKASLTDDGHVLISGGFTKWNAASEFTMRVFDIATSTFSTPPAAAKFIKRGGHAAQRLNNDCIFMFGGVTEFKDLSGSAQQAASDIYCAGHLAQ
ncbi:MAG: hypothetical protein KC502_03580 [Myxococcales bacterium]|nr:hypothetical protein [Myxococcales bacterium]